MPQRKPLVQNSGRLEEMGGTDTISPALLGTGTRDGTKFLRDDGVYAVVPSGGPGEPNTATATIDFGSDPSYVTITTVPAAWTTASTAAVVQPWAATADHEVEDAILEDIRFEIANRVPGVSFDIIARSPNGSTGAFIVRAVEVQGGSSGGGGEANPVAQRLSGPAIATPAAPASGTANLYPKSNNGFTHYKVQTHTGERDMSDRVVVAYNSSGSLIPKGSALNSNGTYNGAYSVTLASANDPTNLAHGVAATDIPAGGYGEAAILGVIGGLNTSAYALGATLYLGTTPGELTTAIPAHPNLLQVVGVVAFSHATFGAIQVNVQANTSSSQGTIQPTFAIGNTTLAGQAGLLLLHNNGQTTEFRAPNAGTSNVLFLPSQSGTLALADASASNPETIQHLAADVSTTGTALVDVAPQFGVALDADSTYVIETTLVYNSAATTTGIGVTYTTSAAPTLISGTARIAGAAADGTDSEFTGNITASADTVMSLNTVVANTNYLVRLEAIIRTGASGITIKPQFRSEISGSAITVRTGSYQILRKIA